MTPRWMLALVVACGGGSRPAAPDAKTEPSVCKTELESSIDRTCTVPGDCVLVDSADCCGVVKLAVKRGTESMFPAAETAYEACLDCPPLGCSHADQAEDGSVAGTDQAIVATCASQRCKSVVQ